MFFMDVTILSSMIIKKTKYSTDIEMHINLDYLVKSGFTIENCLVITGECCKNWNNKIQVELQNHWFLLSD